MPIILNDVIGALSPYNPYIRNFGKGTCNPGSNYMECIAFLERNVSYPFLVQTKIVNPGLPEVRTPQ